MIRTGIIGKGTYGCVIGGKWVKRDNAEIAVKRNIIDSDISFSGSIRELDLLMRLRGHPYIVKLLSVSFGNPFISPNSPIENFNKENDSRDTDEEENNESNNENNSEITYKEDYLHFIFEKGEHNLHKIIHEENGVHISYLKLAMVHILLGVEYMHAKGVIHRDIKPANLLWFIKNGKTYVKLCDFGLSKIHTNQEPSSPHLVTCWYRAPEICLEKSDYSFASDMWSIGCVFYEMVAKTALLIGVKDDDKKLLAKIATLIPNLTEKEMSYLGDFRTKNKYKSWKQSINLNSQSIANFEKYPETTSSSTSSYDNFLDLLNKLLKVFPEERLTATQALAHPFFTPYKEIIEWCRFNYPPEHKIDHMVKIIQCKERKWATNLAFTTFNHRDNLVWYKSTVCTDSTFPEEKSYNQSQIQDNGSIRQNYKHRIVFQSIDLFDRYLDYLISNSKNQLENVLVESNYSGKYMTRYDTELRYLVCLYIAIKYFSTLIIPIPFVDLINEIVGFGDNASDKQIYKSKKALLQAEQFEKLLLREVLKFQTYRETVFEMADRENKKLTENNIRDLLLNYGISESKEMPVLEMFKELSKSQ